MLKNISKELPVVVQNHINCYLHNAYLLCILLAHKTFYNWFYENYIQLYYNPDKISKSTNIPEIWLDFYGGWTMPLQFLDCSRMNRAACTGIDIIEFIEDSINHNRYLYTFININPAKAAPHVHDIFVYGYDRTAKSLSAIGFDNHRTFCAYKIPYHMFAAAFKTGIDFAGLDDARWKEDGYAITIAPVYNEDFTYGFSIKNFSLMLYDYIFSQNTHKRTGNTGFRSGMYENENNVYGMKVYACLLAYLRNFKVNQDCFDFRGIHALYEQKKSLLERFTYVEKQYGYPTGDMVREYTRLTADANQIRSLAMKCALKSGQGILDRIIKAVEAQAACESGLLATFYSKVWSKIPGNP